MSEFYTNFTPEQISGLISNKLSIYTKYDPEFHYERMNNIKLGRRDFEYRAVRQAYQENGFDPNLLEVRRYIGMHNGQEVYHFYNIIYPAE